MVPSIIRSFNVDENASAFDAPYQGSASWPHWGTSLPLDPTGGLASPRPHAMSPQPWWQIDTYAHCTSYHVCWCSAFCFLQLQSWLLLCWMYRKWLWLWSAGSEAVVKSQTVLSIMEVCCPDCNMSFPSRNLLSKHVTQFCVGPSTAIDQLQASVKLWNPVLLDQQLAHS